MVVKAVRNDFSMHRFQLNTHFQLWIYPQTFMSSPAVPWGWCLLESSRYWTLKGLSKAFLAIDDKADCNYQNSRIFSEQDFSQLDSVPQYGYNRKPWVFQSSLMVILENFPPSFLAIVDTK